MSSDSSLRDSLESEANTYSHRSVGDSSINSKQPSVPSSTLVDYVSNSTEAPILETGNKDIEGNSIEDSYAADQKSIEDIDPDFIRVPLPRPSFVIVLIGLGLSAFLAALDQTILTTALEKIVKELGDQELIPWVGSAFLLSSTSFSVLYGKISDIFGRKPTFLFALVIFLAGSTVCALAPSLPVLIAGRAIAGVGGGGICTLVVIITSDIVSIADRGKYQAISGAAVGLAWTIGPLMGGALSDHASWRYCFWINIPLGFITLITFTIFMKSSPTSSIKENIRRIDFLGSVVLMAAVCCLITPLQLGGSTWDWNAPQTIGLFGTSTVLFAIFAYIELQISQEPIIPYNLFTNRSVPALLFIAFLLDAALFPGLFYVSLFFQVCYGMSAVQAGLQTIPMVFGYVLMVIISGQILSRTGHYLPFLYIGPLIIITAIGLSSTLSSTSTTAQQIGYILITGVGRGTISQIQILALHASVDSSKLAVATSVSQFCQALGGTIGIAVMGTILNNLFSMNIRDNPTIMKVLGNINPAKVNLPMLREALRERSPTLLTELINAFVGAFQISYRSLIAWAGLMFIMAFFVKDYKLKKRPKR
ncbi:hypothetical protein HDU97_009973 [Phlyctochytrium planicorne]|nr:hypothetical protein HDU97_009973 [Phlyctochytrium planicorne]